MPREGVEANMISEGVDVAILNMPDEPSPNTDGDDTDAADLGTSPHQIAQGRLFSVRYDDGDVEEGLREELVRPQVCCSGGLCHGRGCCTNDLPHTFHQVAFQPGDVVEAQYGGGDQWYPGRIEDVATQADLGVEEHDTVDGVTFDIEYDDGDFESGVRSSLVRSLQDAVPEESMKGVAADSGDEALGEPTDTGDKIADEACPTEDANANIDGDELAAPATATATAPAPATATAQESLPMPGSAGSTTASTPTSRQSEPSLVELALVCSSCCCC